MILSDVQQLVIDNMVTLFEIDLTSRGGDIERYHPHNDGVITWQGNAYHPWSIKAEGFSRTSDGQQPTPTLVVGNIGVDLEGNPISGVVTALCLAFDDLVGATVTRKRTFKKYLDAVNFPGGNPTADPNEHLPDELWLITQKRTETPEVVEFTLGSPMQLDGVKLPRRQIITNVCGWLVNGSVDGGYRGAYCGYTGSAMFDKNGNPVTDPAADECGGTPEDCKIRFGENNTLRYGGFASTDRIR